MANMNKSFINLSDPVTITFTDQYGEKHHGIFRFRKRLTANDRLLDDQRRRAQLGPLTEAVSMEANIIATMAGKLSILVGEAPTWWGAIERGGVELPEDVMEHVLSEAVKVRGSYISSIEQQGDDAADRLRKQREADQKAETPA